MAVMVSVTLILVAILILVLIHVCIVVRALRRGFENEITSNNGDASMCRDDLEKLPCFEFMAMEERNGSPVDCAVCLGKFEMGDKCRMLPLCKHSFHARCVDEWLLVTPICPICRTNTLESLKGCGGREGNVVLVTPTSS
ncbi:E3 ubiquitin-protein ligase ATL4-like [Momordica charantia]|uniref:RING-type E3 ubiquitin transferase n=1 Tax=Momordica charantia TaxID=3673 RepID=A0A6J1BYM3_MOMCH|nr:E3 ubiquitin-protein ligase ATL4-like [Momordica charantia]